MTPRVSPPHVGGLAGFFIHASPQVRLEAPHHVQGNQEKKRCKVLKGRKRKSSEGQMQKQQGDNTRWACTGNMWFFTGMQDTGQRQEGMEMCASHLLLRLCSLRQEERLPHSQALKDKITSVMQIVLRGAFNLGPLPVAQRTSDREPHPGKKTEASERDCRTTQILVGAH